MNPNEAKVLQPFGRYAGTVHEQGLKWANPFFSKKKISVRVRNFETTKLKVNDKRGTPIEIAAVAVWKVVDSAEAFFEVDNYEDFVHVVEEAGAPVDEQKPKGPQYVRTMQGFVRPRRKR